MLSLAFCQFQTEKMWIRRENKWKWESLHYCQKYYLNKIATLLSLGSMMMGRTKSQHIIRNCVRWDLFLPPKNLPSAKLGGNLKSSSSFQYQLDPLSHSPPIWLFFWMSVGISPKFSCTFVKHPWDEMFLFRLGDWFLLYQLGKNIDPLVFRYSHPFQK